MTYRVVTQTHTQQKHLQFGFIPNSGSEIYDQTYQWQISVFLLTTLPHSTKLLPLHRCTIEQRWTTPQHDRPSNIPKQLAAAAPRHLLFYGWVHRATNIRKTDSTNSTTAIFVPAKHGFLLICITWPINGLWRQTTATTKHDKCPSHYVSSSATSSTVTPRVAALHKLTVSQLVKKVSILWNPKVHHRVHNIPPVVPILKQTNPVYVLLIHFLNIQFSICHHLRLDLPSGLFPSSVKPKTIYTPYAMFSSRLLLPPSKPKHLSQHRTPHTLTNFHINTKQLYFRRHTNNRNVTTRSLFLFPQHDAGADGLQVWTVTADILKKQ
jgi:hypothetical protein